MKARRYVLLPILLAFFLAESWLSAAARPQQRNQVTLEGDTVTIHVPIDFHSLEGYRTRHPENGRRIDAEELIPYWVDEAERIWNDGLLPFTYRGCYALQLDIEGHAIPLRVEGHSGHHQVWYMAAGYRSQVYRNGRAGRNEDDAAPYSTSGEGFWGWVPAATVAHEVGHLIGLGDDYTDPATGGGRGSVPLEGRQRTLMSVYQQGTPSTWIDQDLVNRLGDLAGQELNLPPCIQGSVLLRQRNDTQGHSRMGELDLIVFVRPEADGQLRGEASGTFTLTGEVEEGGCSFSYGTSAQVELELKASGNGDGPFRIEALEGQSVEEMQTNFLCSQQVALTIDWDVTLLLEGIRFQDACYEKRESQEESLFWYLGRGVVSPPSPACPSLVSP